MARIGNLSSAVNVFVNRALAPELRQKLVANAAREILVKALDKNRQVLGKETHYEQFVDGRKGAPLESVNLKGGRIVFAFDLLSPVLDWIGEQLVLHSPVKDPPIHYYESHILFADDVEVSAGEPIPAAESYTFVNAVPYARKIERGESQQAADGVYDVIADMASRRFGNIAQIKFTYRSIHMPYVALGGRKGGKTASSAKRSAHNMETATRNPAILVVPR